MSLSGPAGCVSELVAQNSLSSGGLHDGPGARVLEGIRVRAGPRASAFTVASANRPGGYPAATSTSAFRQIVMSPVRCHAAVAVACDRRGGSDGSAFRPTDAVAEPGLLGELAAEVVRGQARGSADDGVLHRPQGCGGSGRYPDLHLRTDVPERYLWSGFRNGLTACFAPLHGSGRGVPLLRWGNGDLFVAVAAGARQ
jgi:hypothetical protein